MKNLIGVCLLVLLGFGCSKEEPKPVVTETPAELPPAATPTQPRAVIPPASQRQPAAQPTAAPKPQVQPVAGVKPLEGRVDAHMTALLKRFIAQKGRMPGSVLELAGATSDSFPLAPAGFIYAIDPATSEVKLVKQ